ncbi:hypothetical protein VDG1235_1519 [Verrucomicrobiia bacterium DG1235]|nr:hypothetical protein VDG1235_1519 [Verrucomicrobiae bacterium DG1235]
MSLINQALKLEQQKRHAPSGPQPPMVSHMARHGQSDRLPLILIGFTGMGLLLAFSISAIFYFGSGYLKGETALAAQSQTPQLATPSSDKEHSPTSESPTTDAAELTDLLSELSSDQLSTVQKMLLEREQATNPSKAATETKTANQPAVVTNELDLAEVSRIQELVDGFTVQGIRKAGKETRVFLDGKIRRIGDVVDIENGLVLVGFTEIALIFHTQTGQSFEKAL